MKKLLALLLSFLMAFSCIGLAEENSLLSLFPNEQMAVGSVEVSEENVLELFSFFGFETEESDTTLVQNLVKFINACSLTFAYDLEAGCVECVLVLNETPAVNFTLSRKDDQFVFQSDLIPSYAITISEETLSALTNSVSETAALYLLLSAMGVQAITPYLQNIIAPVLAKVEGPAKVNLDMGNYVFDTSYTLHMTLAEISADLADSISDMLQDETIVNILESCGITLTEQDFDEFWALLENLDVTIDAQLVTCSKNGAMYMDVTLQCPDNTIFILFQADDTYIMAACGYGPSAEDPSIIYQAAAQAEDALWVEAAYDPANRWGYMDVIYAGLYLGLEGIAVQQEDGMISRTDVYFLNTETPLLSAYIGLYDSAEFLDENFDIEGLVAVDGQKLLDGDADAFNMLYEDFSTNGINAALGAVSIALPDDMNYLLATLYALLQ